MASPVTDALETNKTRFVYDANFNLIEIREFARTAILGDESKVRVTVFLYDSSFNLVKILPAYRLDDVTADDLDLTP